MAPISHPNILKLGKSKLVVVVRKTFPFDRHPPCPSNCSSSPLHITFRSSSKQRFLDPRRVSFSSLSNSSRVIAKHLEFVGEKTICQDGSLFFQLEEKANSRLVVKTALRSLKIKKSRHGRIFKKLMAFGRQYMNVGNEKKVLKGLVVNIKVVQSLIGDRDSVREAMKQSWEERKSEARGDGSIFRVPIFHVKWVDMNKGIKVDDLGYTLVNLNRLGFLNDPFVLAKHVKQVCYIDDPLEKLWSVVLKLPEKNFYKDDDDENDGSVEAGLENECFLPNLPNVNLLEEDATSYMRDVDELIQLA